MKKTLIALAVFLTAALGIGGYFIYQDGLVPVPLTERLLLFVPGNPEFGEDQARVEALMLPGPKTEAFLTRQAALTVLEEQAGGAFAGQLATALEVSRHGRRWRLTLVQGWRLQDGSQLDAANLAAALAPRMLSLGGDCRVVGPRILDLRFKVRPPGMPGLLAQWPVAGSGPFVRQGNVLTRFEGFTPGKAGFATVEVRTDPALLEGRAWADGLASARWAWAVFPGQVAPEDMARVRLAPYDELRMKDGSVWFLSRRLRRLRPDQEDWTRTRLFGAWKGAMDLPYDPLGM